MLPIKAIEQYGSENILGFDQAVNLIQQLKQTNKTVGLCHGGFDLTHPGHVKHFESAKKQCDILIVSITADQFVTSRKGSGRPVYTDKLRAYIIANIKFVDFVVITNFKLGVDVIQALKPTFYIKGPDFINKTTPGITAEREAIKSVGGEIKYTTEPPMSTTKIIEYVKNQVLAQEVLVIIDRDDTIIEDTGFFGKEDNWKELLTFKEDTLSFISYLQTKYKTTKIVVSNQTGVARKLFDCQRVEEINKSVNTELINRGIKIDSWQYCPDADTAYAEAKKDQLEFDIDYVKEQTKRKPSTRMVDDALEELGKNIKTFSKIIVIGDKEDADGGLATNLQAKYIDVKGKSYEELVKEVG